MAKTSFIPSSLTRLSLLVLLGGLLALAPSLEAFSQDRKPKNIILMIPDGASLATLSLSRWYQRMLSPLEQRLHLDPYLCGTVLTYCSNAPIGDSAPTTSAYMTGVPSIEGFVSTYPYSTGKDDLVPLDSTLAYRPIATLMEAAKHLQNKKVGLVMTSEFPHATPADCIAHSYNRKKYGWIVPQMVHHGVDVVIGGGVSILGEEHKKELEKKGFTVQTDDYEGMKAYKGGKLWSLFAPNEMPYDLDLPDHKPMPTIEEMTLKAIQTLDSEEGFFLMVEGSKVDWAAHANDPVGMVTDMLAFDKAVGAALEFAKKDGNTVVIVTTDHGNSGVSIGSSKVKGYSSTSAEEIFGALTRIKRTATGLADLLQKAPYTEAKQIFSKWANITLTEEEYQALANVKGYRSSPLLENNRKNKQEGSLYSEALTGFVAQVYRSRMPSIAFTTNGHTGEEVFLAVYAPEGVERLMGFNTNIDLHNYMKRLLGVSQTMLEISEEFYRSHREAFKGYKMRVLGNTPEEKILEVRYRNKQVRVKAFTNTALVNGKEFRLNTPVIYVDKNDTFYLPVALVGELTGIR